jgi:hypothetical protein
MTFKKLKYLHKNSAVSVMKIRDRIVSRVEQLAQSSFESDGGNEKDCYDLVAKYMIGQLCVYCARNSVRYKSGDFATINNTYIGACRAMKYLADKL